MIDPVTEASPAAVLITFLTIFGAMVGPGPYVLADAATHAPRLFALIVGKTARARKGTSYRQARFVFDKVDKAFVDRRVFGGFGSGEALIEAVGGVVDGNDDDDESAEAPDKRALIVEEEFAKVLRVSERDGSTLSMVLRQAWDGADLSALTRKRPVRAKGAHICVLAHCTEDELLARMRGVEIANGFANRYVVIRAERSKRLPEGGGLHRDEAERLAYEWRKSLERARSLDRIQRSPEASALWRDWYLQLDDDRPGMIGALLARAEAQVLRLSLLYALVDGDAVIDVPHLLAALDVWRYAEQSTLAIFGDAVGDPVADLILRRLRERRDGLTRTDIREVVGHHEREVTIEAALSLLEGRNLARSERLPSGAPGKRGRSIERWHAVFPPEEREETGEKVAYLPSLPSLRTKVEPRDGGFGEGSQVARDLEAELRSGSLSPPSNNRYLLTEDLSGSFGDSNPQEGDPKAPA